VARDGIAAVIDLLDVLAVLAFPVRGAEQALLDAVAPVPAAIKIVFRGDVLNLNIDVCNLRSPTGEPCAVVDGRGYSREDVKDRRDA
jgi:hypothetical protein